MLKKFAVTCITVAALFVGLGAVKVAQIKEMSSQPHVPPLTSVATAEARMENWRPTLGSIATLAPVQGVLIGAEADGAIVKIHVDNGASVRAGDVLLEIDTAVEAAQLRASVAQLELARVSARRANDLREKSTISQAEQDEAVAQLNQAEANVAALRATIDKKTVRAPFDGRVGIRSVNIGQFVSRGDPLLPLHRLDALYVNFTIPQRQLGEISVGQKVQVKVDAFNDQVFEGEVNAINPQVDSATRNVSVQATLANPEEKLRPGMFVRVEVQLPAQEPHIVLPATAVAYAPYGNSVFIVEKMKDKEGKEYLGVRQQFVKVGHTRGDLVAIEGGVKPGEQVASAGVFKLRNGMPVQVNNAVQPAANPDPKPANS